MFYTTIPCSAHFGILRYHGHVRLLFCLYIVSFFLWLTARPVFSIVMCKDRQGRRKPSGMCKVQWCVCQSLALLATSLFAVGTLSADRDISCWGLILKGGDEC